MNVSGIDSKPRIVLAKPIDVDIGNHIHRGSCTSVPENSLEIGLDGHVRDLSAIEDVCADCFG